MANLILKSEILNNVLENKPITRQEIIDVYQNSIKNSNDLFLTAQNLRIKNKSKNSSFSKKAFCFLQIISPTFKTVSARRRKNIFDVKATN